MMNNNAIQNRFRIIFNEPELTFLEERIVAAVIPSITGGLITQPTSIIPIFKPGNSLDITDFTTTVLLDEEYITWKNMFDWIVYNKNLKTIGEYEKVCDCNITILSNKYNPIFDITLKDIFPYSIDSVPLDVSISETDPIKFSIVWKVNGIEIK